MPAPKVRPSGNLPIALSSFIGRAREIDAVIELISAHRLVTLTGAGGSGKTRLSVRVAGELAGEFEHGVWFVELASLSDSTFLSQTIATTLNILEQSGRSIMDVLVDYLSGCQALVVIDNCEHLIAACAQLTEKLLQKCSELKILATSREALGITGEVVWTVPPLSLPDPQPWRDTASGPKAISVYEQSEAIQLFVHCAQFTATDFNLTLENGAVVAEICRRLDGMPLAIELAAARVRSLSVQQIAQRLDDRFHLLTGGSRTALPRQQTLEATLDWSYALLLNAEQKVLQRLSVFAGGAALNAIESVCTGEEVEASEALDLLSRLVDKSLVVVDKREVGETRYRLLETIRQYALERLHDSGEVRATYRRHMEWFLKLAEQSQPELQGGNQRDWLERLARENDNFRTALAWSLENDTTMALQLAGVLGQFWFMRGHHFEEGKEWLEKVISRTKTSEQEVLRAKAFNWLGTLAYFHGDYARARSAYEDSLRLYQNVHDPYGVAQSAYFLADAVAVQGDNVAAGALYATARSLAEESLSGLREQGDKWKIARTLNILGEIARVGGDYITAHSCYEESLMFRRELGDQRGIAVSLINLGYVAQHQGDHQRAIEFFTESLEFFQNLASTRGIVDCLAAFAGVAGAEQQSERAARLFGATETLNETFHTGLAAAYSDRVEYDRSIAAVRSQLSEDAFAIFWAEGRALTLDQAVNYAPSESETLTPDLSLKEKFGGLTAREREVAVLIAQGKSNREIAKVMTVGVRTVETYVTRILSKLGFDSRVQIAMWAKDTGLI